MNRKSNSRVATACTSDEKTSTLVDPRCPALTPRTASSSPQLFLQERFLLQTLIKEEVKVSVAFKINQVYLLSRRHGRRQRSSLCRQCMVPAGTSNRLLYITRLSLKAGPSSSSRLPIMLTGLFLALIMLESCWLWSAQLSHQVLFFPVGTFGLCWLSFCSLQTFWPTWSLRHNH